MDVGRELIARAKSEGAKTLVVVGTSKNAGKSVVVAALADACERAGDAYAMASIGRDGEASDAIDASPKPRFFLRPGAIVATAAGLVPRTPACEVVRVSGERSALGRIVIVRVRAAQFVELAGPPRASALRRIVDILGTFAPFVIVDGAIDRVAPLRDGGDAIVVAVGATGSATLEHAVDDIGALVERLRLPALADACDGLRARGALTLEIANEHARLYGRSRPLVVADPTAVAVRGRAFLELLGRIDLRCERTLLPIACTVAPFGRERSFDPRAFARAVARRTGLPTYDVFAQTVA